MSTQYRSNERRSSFYDNKIAFLKDALYDPLDSVDLVIEEDASIDEFVRSFAKTIRWLRDVEDLYEPDEE